MTLPANVRVNFGAPFPATVKGSGVIGILKSNGIWTVSLNYGALSVLPSIADPANTVVLVFNTITGVYSLTPLAGVSASKQIKIIPISGVYNALPSDDVVLLKAVPFTVNVDWSARSKPLTVVANCDATVNNVTIIPSAGQTQLSVVDYHVIIDSIGGSVTLTPLPDGTGAY